MLKLPSVEDGVYLDLRKRIVELDLRPEARLKLDRLAQQLGVSHMPVRQALRQLESEGLVITMPRRGSRVAPLTADELEEIQIIRLGVETFLARLGALQRTAAVQAEMERRLEDVGTMFVHRDLGGYLEAQAALRDLCYSSAQRPRLHKVAIDQRRRAERYLRFLCASIDALAESHQHQIDFVAACRDRDGAAAEDATRRALVWTLQSMGTLLEASAAPAAIR